MNLQKTRGRKKKAPRQLHRKKVVPKKERPGAPYNPPLEPSQGGGPSQAPAGDQAGPSNRYEEVDGNEESADVADDPRGVGGGGEGGGEGEIKFLGGPEVEEEEKEVEVGGSERREGKEGMGGGSGDRGMKRKGDGEEGWGMAEVGREKVHRQVHSEGGEK